MYQYTNDIPTVPGIFNINDSSRTFVQPVKNLENSPNSQNANYVPKIKIKDLKELQDPSIISKTEINNCNSDPYLNVLNSKADNSLVDTRDSILSVTNENLKHDHSYVQKTCSPQTTNDKLTYHNLDIWLKERSLKDSLLNHEENPELIQNMKNKMIMLFQNNQTYSLSRPNSKSSIPEIDQNLILVGRRNHYLDMRCCMDSTPISQTEVSSLSKKPNSIDPYDAINNVGVTNHISQNHVEEIGSFNVYDTISNVGITNHISQSCIEEISNLTNTPNSNMYNGVINVGVTNHVSQNCIEEISNLPNSINMYNAISNVGVINHVSQNCIEEMSNLPNTPNSINMYNAISNVGVTNHVSQNCGQEIQNCFEFICMGESSYIELGTDITPKSVVSVTSSNTKNVNGSLQKSMVGKCDTDCKSRQMASPNSNIKLPHDYESRKTVLLNSYVNQSQDDESSQTAGPNSNVNQSQDYVKRQCASLNSNVNKPQDHESSQTAAPSSNINQSQDYEKRQCASLNSNVNKSQDNESSQTADRYFNVSQSQDSEKRQSANLNSDKNKLHMSSIEISDEVDSTGLRNGIINASRTLISTEKLLKSLLHTISRTASLPPKQAISVLRKFQSISKSFNQGFEKIDNNVKNEYKHLFSNSLDKGQDIKELLGNHKQNIEIIPKQKENCSSVDIVNEIIPKQKENCSSVGIVNEIIPKQKENCSSVDIVNEQPNAFIHSDRRQALNTEQKTKTICRKRRRQRASKSDDEELDKSFEPAVQVRNIVNSIRHVPQRSCRKRHISLAYEPQEFEDESDGVLF